MISLIIPTIGTNSDYTDNLINNIRDLYPNENEVEIVLHIDDTVTLGINYNNAVAKAKGDKIILLHNDMAIKPGFIETIQFKIKNLVTCQDKTYPDNTLYKNYVKSFNRKHDPELDSWNKLIKHWNKLIKNKS